MYKNIIKTEYSNQFITMQLFLINLGQIQKKYKHPQLQQKATMKQFSKEEKCIQIDILNQSKTIKLQQFLTFNQIVTNEDIKQTKVIDELSHNKLSTLNTFIYYIVCIQKGVKIFPNQQSIVASSDKYRILCTKRISDFYIQSNMNIDIYEFSLLSSKLLGMKLEQCTHIIYYLIYGRFASHPYIHSLCNRNDYDFRKKVFRKTTFRDSHQNNKFHRKSQYGGAMINSSEYQMQKFCQQLKIALSPKDSYNHNMNKTMLGRKNFLSEFNKNDDGKSKHMSLSRQNDQNNNKSNQAEQRKQTINKGTSTFIPQRITQNQNSSIMENLPFHQKQYKTCTDWNKKGLMRKQKFNDFFDATKFKLKTNLKHTQSQQIDKQNKENKIFGIDVTANTLGKINYENFKNISYELKNKNLSLDKIRTECSMRYKKNNEKPNLQLFELQRPKKKQKQKDSQIDFKQKQKDRVSEFQNQRQSLGKTVNLSNSSDKELSFLNIKRTMTSFDGFKEKPLILQKSMSYQPMRNVQEIPLDIQTSKDQQQYTMNLLRNDETQLNRESQQAKKLDYFSKNSIGLKKMNCKFKLQKYKSDYRKFMKTQLLDRIKQAS